MAHPGTITGGNLELDGDTVQIFSGTVGTDSLRLRAIGGSFEVANATLNAFSQGDLAGIDFGATGGGTGAVSASFTNAMVDVAGSGSSNRSLFVRNASSLTIDGGLLNISHLSSNLNRAALEIESDGMVTMTNGATLTSQVLRIDNEGLGLDFNSGDITLAGTNAIRGTNSFDGQLSFSGIAESAIITHLDATDSDVVRHLAGRVTAGFFAIDGITIAPATIYDGTNVLAVNAELETLAVNGRFFEIVQAGDVQSLHLRASVIPEPSCLVVLASASAMLLRRRRQ